jgi:hypothetical protein
MSPLFRKGEDKAEQEAAGNAAVERLVALSETDLAAEIMPVFGADGPRGSGGLNAVQIAQWLVSPYPRHPSLKPLIAPIQRASETLAKRGLVEQRMSGIGTGSSSTKATPLGQQALADQAVRQYLEAPTS